MSLRTAHDGSVLVVGTCNIDLSLHTGHLPQPGETVLGELTTTCGGKAANQAVAAARLGADVALVTRIGDDQHGRTLLAELTREGVDISGVRQATGGASGVALIMVDDRADTVIGVAAGVNQFMQVGDLDERTELQNPRAIVLAEMGIPFAVIERLCHLQAQVGFTFILNPAPATAPLDSALWPCIDVVTPNATEAEALTGIAVTGEDSALRAADRLHAFGVDLAIVTLGDRGVAYAMDGDSGLIPAYPVTAVDTTAASDAFNGGLAVALRSGHDVIESIRYAQAVAALSATRRGAQSSLPTAHEVAEFLSNQVRLQEYA